MALTEPLELLADFPGWCTAFELQARQEQSRHASGRTRVKDFGQPIWRASYVTSILSPNTLDRWRAMIGHAHVSQKTFKGIPLSRCRPIAHPGSAVLPAGTLAAIGDDDDTVSLAGLTGISISIGDMIRIGTGLYRALEPKSGTPTGLFAIEPHLWPGTATSQAVIIDKPWVAMTIDPQSVSESVNARTGRGSISFSATEAR